MKTARCLLLLMFLSLAASQSLVQAQGGKGSSGGGGGGGGGTQPPPVFNPLSATGGYAAANTGLGSTTTGTVNLINPGSAAITIRTMTLGGPNAVDFTLGGTCAAGLAVPQKTGNTCAIQIAFHPTATGNRTAAISFTFTNATAVTLNLSGLGLAAAPQITTSLGPIVWDGTTPVGSSAAPVTITVQNTGVQTLSLSNFSFGGANPGDFVFAAANRGFSNCFAGDLLAPTAQCFIGVNFAPTDVGTRSAVLNIFSNDPTHPVVAIPLSATAVAGSPPPPPPPPPPPTPVVSAFDVTDLWGTANEAGWSLSISHHKQTTDVLTATWQTFDVDGRGMWLKLTDGHWVNSLTYTGNLHRLTGPAFAIPYDASLVTDATVGTATLTFTDAGNGTFTYTVNGVSGSKTITRVVF